MTIGVVSYAERYRTWRFTINSFAAMRAKMPSITSSPFVTNATRWHMARSYAVQKCRPGQEALRDERCQTPFVYIERFRIPAKTRPSTSILGRIIRSLTVGVR